MSDTIEQPILMSSRRTVMDGEVVTLSLRFEERDGIFGKCYNALGPIEVSASRERVIVHRASFNSAEGMRPLIKAIEQAERIRATLEPYQRGGHPSMFPSEPTPADAGNLDAGVAL